MVLKTPDRISPPDIPFRFPCNACRPSQSHSDSRATHAAPPSPFRFPCNVCRPAYPIPRMPPPNIPFRFPFLKRRASYLPRTTPLLTKKQNETTVSGDERCISFCFLSTTKWLSKSRMRCHFRDVGCASRSANPRMGKTRSAHPAKNAAFIFLNAAFSFLNVRAPLLNGLYVERGDV